jgi:hypothetical protein
MSLAGPAVRHVVPVIAQIVVVIQRHKQYNPM